MTEVDYYRAFSISSVTDYVIHLKRSPASYFVNKYDPVLLKAWEANLDIQSVHNYYKALTFMTDYFSKSASEVSESLKQVVGEIEKQNLNMREEIRKTGYTILLLHVN